MFENLNINELQHYWWMIISLLGAILVFLLFVQGGQSLIYEIGKDDDNRSLILNSTGRKWEFTFTTLVTFGGAFFASFPLFYATSFGGAYWAWNVLLFCFIVQAVSYQYRSKENNFLGRKTYDFFLFLNGCLAPILIGTVVGSFFTGSSFTLSETNIVYWQSNFRGLELLFEPQNIILGLILFFLSRVQACLYLKNSIESDSLIPKINITLIRNAGAFVGLILFWVIVLVLSDGYEYNAQGIVKLVKYKYLNNLIEMPINTSILVIGLFLILFAIIISIRKAKYTKGIWFSGVGTILLSFSLFILAGFNNTCFYPSSTDIQSSLTIQNSSSSHYTLTAMSYISIIIPFVFGYIWYAWKSINRKKIDIDELANNHKY